jgi:hypothetical protein
MGQIGRQIDGSENQPDQQDQREDEANPTARGGLVETSSRFLQLS